MSKTWQGWFLRFDRRPGLYLGIALSAYLLINNTINATSEWMEATRFDQQPGFKLWEPFVWEYSSAIATLLLLPLLFRWLAIFPFQWRKVKSFLLLNLVASLVFSLAHVGLMVFFRKLVYSLQQMEYHFGPWVSEFFYEYRKDAWGFVFFIMLYYSYRFIYSRLKGEASLLDQQEKTIENPSGTSSPEHLLVRKLDKEFVVKVDDIEWLEAAGNYVNLHCQGRIYPLRSTLSGLIPRLSEKGFSQVHRSFAVNISQITSIDNLPGGDGCILLKSGQKIALSRRYKDNFKQNL